MTNIDESLKKLAELLLASAKLNLQKANKNKIAGTLKTNIADAKIDFIAVDYAIFVEKGRRKSAPMPPLSAIVNWIKLNDLKIPITAAYPIARSISAKGITPLYFLRNAIKVTADVKKILRDAMQKMVEENINKK